jgi:hypothetical protein
VTAVTSRRFFETDRGLRGTNDSIDARPGSDHFRERQPVLGAHP